jgi:hypothetical protein
MLWRYLYMNTEQTYRRQQLHFSPHYTLDDTIAEDAA